MNVYKELTKVEKELEKLYKMPTTEENENKIADLEEIQRSLAWDFDARIF